MPTHYHCTGCGRRKSSRHFRFSRGKRVSKRCKACHRDDRYRRRYGVSAYERDLMDREQAGRCAICNSPPPEGQVLHLDHDHCTGETRELLCSPCNLLLGHAREDPEVLLAAIDYLQRHKDGRP